MDLLASSPVEETQLVLPTFLGIGVQRAGTTWLHKLLAGHPQVYMPTRRKEIRFFERYYERGPGWYSSFFPSPEEAGCYQAIGEISTQYYDCQKCPERISKCLPEIKMIIMLRHPVSRAYSHYGFVVQRRNYDGSFEEFLRDRPKSLEKGFYSRFLKRYLQYFDRTQILALLFEEAVDDVSKTKRTLSDFLKIELDQFPSPVGGGKVNASSVPTFQALTSLAVTTARTLRKWHMEPVVDFVRRRGIMRILAKGSPLPPLDEELKQRLSQRYLGEFDELEECMQIDLSCWRQEE